MTWMKRTCSATGVAVIHRGRLVATDTPDNLKRHIAVNGNSPTLEDVFLHLTGEQLLDHDGMPTEAGE